MLNNFQILHNKQLSTDFKDAKEKFMSFGKIEIEETNLTDNSSNFHEQLN